MKLTESAREQAKVQWAQLAAAEWTVVTEENDPNGDDPLWQKESGFLKMFLTHLETGWEFALHGIDDEVLVEQMLTATNFDDAADQCDELMTEFITIGASSLATDEIRIVQAFSHEGYIVGVGVDGKLYEYGGTTWHTITMKLTAS